MRIRQGFVSNSSSSSFIICDLSKEDKIAELCKKCYNDYYIFNNRIYTSFISDGYDEWCDFRNLVDDSDESIDGGHGEPYDEDDFVEVEGIMGIRSVYIPREYMTDKEAAELDVPPHNRDRILYNYVKKADIDKDSINSMWDFIEHCYDIIGGEYDED